MTVQRFGRLKTALFATGDAVGDGIAGALESQGFRDIRRADSVDGLTRILREDNIDLVISITRLDKQFVGNVIRNLRLGLLDRSPFPIVLALLPSADEEHVRAVINAGVDDLLLLPPAPDALFKRIAQFVQDRRPFVITHDYIGPDRRQSIRPGESSTPIVKVPNPVRSRVVGIEDAAIEHAIDEAILVVDRYKLKQNGLQLLWLLDRLRRGRADPPPSDSISLSLFLRKCREICDDVDRRAKGNAERSMRSKATTVSALIDDIAASAESGALSKLTELIRAADDLVDYIAAYYGEQLKL